MVYAVFAVFPVRSLDYFCISSGFERVSFFLQLFTDLNVIINFTVKNYPAVEMMHWLCTILAEIKNAQPVVSKHNGHIDTVRSSIRSTVRNTIKHSLNCRLRLDNG